jgi:hypothetical protein
MSAIKEIQHKIKSKILISDSGCWVWQGPKRGKAKDGFYGGFKWMCKNYLAHRISYMVFKEAIPDDKLVCHSCDNPLCVNPEHLFIGTQTDNMRDMSKKMRGTHGEKSYPGKLTVEKVLKIRAMGGTMYNREIAALFNVSTPTITTILNRKSWKHI